eukprot:gene33096-40842_t
MRVLLTKFVRLHERILFSSSVNLLTATPRKKRSPRVPWHKKIRNSSPANVQTFNALREVLFKQRKRHILNLNDNKNKTQECVVNVHLLRRFLRDPRSARDLEHMSRNLAESAAAGPSVIHSEVYAMSSPFLLLTQGALEAIEVLIVNRKIFGRGEYGSFAVI